MRAINSGRIAPKSKLALRKPRVNRAGIITSPTRAPISITNSRARPALRDNSRHHQSDRHPSNRHQDDQTLTGRRATPTKLDSLKLDSRIPDNPRLDSPMAIPMILTTDRVSDRPTDSLRMGNPKRDNQMATGMADRLSDRPMDSLRMGNPKRGNLRPDSRMAMAMADRLSDRNRPISRLPPHRHRPITELINPNPIRRTPIPVLTWSGMHPLPSLPLPPIPMPLTRRIIEQRPLLPIRPVTRVRRRPSPLTPT